jgi:hypothetical protein
VSLVSGGRPSNLQCCRKVQDAVRLTAFNATRADKMNPIAMHLQLAAHLDFAVLQCIFHCSHNLKDLVRHEVNMCE